MASQPPGKPGGTAQQPDSPGVKDPDTAAADSSQQDRAVSTATSAATDDPEKKEAIRAEREKIVAAQERIRRLTGGRGSRTGSDIVAVGTTEARISKTTTETMDIKASPTVYMDPLTGACKQIDPPAPKVTLPGMATGETTDTAGSGSRESRASRGGLSGVQILMPANDNEVVAVQCIAKDNQGRRIRVRSAVGDHQPSMGEVISIRDMYGPGLDFKGKVIDVSEPMIVERSRITALTRTEQSLAKIAEKKQQEQEAAKAAAYAKLTQSAGFDPTDEELVLDVDVPPQPTADETSKEQVIVLSSDSEAPKVTEPSPSDTGEGTSKEDPATGTDQAQITGAKSAVEDMERAADPAPGTSATPRERSKTGDDDKAPADPAPGTSATPGEKIKTGGEVKAAADQAPGTSAIRGEKSKTGDEDKAPADVDDYELPPADEELHQPQKKETGK